MKKIMLLCATMAAMFVSCSKDYDELIVGKWRIQSTQGMSQTIDDGSSDQPAGQIEYVDYWGWVFESDGNGYAYEISNGSETTTGIFSYYINGKELHINSNGGQFGWNIEKLNSRKLSLGNRIYMTDVEGNFIRYDYCYLNFKRE